MFGKKALKGELVGAVIKVSDSSNKMDIGLEGNVIDETKNMITVKTKKGIKKLIKENIIIIKKV